MRDLSLSDTIFVLENCTKRNSSKCNLCILNDEFGDACIEIKDYNALKHLREYEKNLENAKLSKKFGRND
jgi:hypothetical protein